MNNYEKQKQIDKINYILHTVGDYMHSNFKVVCLDKHCLGCKWYIGGKPCKLQRVDLRNNAKAKKQYTREQIEIAYYTCEMISRFS